MKIPTSKSLRLEKDRSREPRSREPWSLRAPLLFLLLFTECCLLCQVIRAILHLTEITPSLDNKGEVDPKFLVLCLPVGLVNPHTLEGQTLAINPRLTLVLLAVVTLSLPSKDRGHRCEVSGHRPQFPGVHSQHG